MTSRSKNRLNRVAILRYDGRHQEGKLPSSLERTARQVGSADMEVQGPGSLQRSDADHAGQDGRSVGGRGSAANSRLLKAERRGRDLFGGPALGQVEQITGSPSRAIGADQGFDRLGDYGIPMKSSKRP